MIEDPPFHVFADGRALRLTPMTYGKVRITISSDEHVGWYDDGW